MLRDRDNLPRRVGDAPLKRQLLRHYRPTSQSITAVRRDPPRGAPAIPRTRARSPQASTQAQAPRPQGGDPLCACHHLTRGPWDIRRAHALKPEYIPPWPSGGPFYIMFKVINLLEGSHPLQPWDVRRAHYQGLRGMPWPTLGGSRRGGS